MKAAVTFEVEIEVEVPNGFTEQVRQLQKELGDNYLSATPTDREIIERIATIRGLRGLSNDEALDEALNQAVRIVRQDEDVIDFNWLVPIGRR